MSNADPDRLESLAGRLVRLEELLMHLERTTSDLGDVARQLEKRLDALEQSVKVLGRQMLVMSEPAAEPRTLEEERPPHY